MVKRSILSRFEGGTGGSDHSTQLAGQKSQTKVTVELISHIGNHTLLIVSLLEHYSYLITYSARMKGTTRDADYDTIRTA